jgi:hypothetical protein
MTRIVLFLVAIFLAVGASPITDGADPKIPADVKHAAERVVVQTYAQAAQRKFSTPAGHAYVENFIKTVGASVISAMRKCGDRSRIGAAVDMIFVVRADGHLDLVFYDHSNAFGACIAHNIHLETNPPKPPADNWPVQLHIVNGPRSTQGPDQPYATMSF